MRFGIDMRKRMRYATMAIMWSHFVKWFREHALWDAAKEVVGWLWAAGGSAVTLAAQTVLGLVRKHQDLTALLLTAGVFLVLIGVAKYMSRRNSNGRVLKKAPVVDADAEVKFAQTEEYRHPPFHPNLAECGRRIESALYGSARKRPANVTPKVHSFAAARLTDIPVNHYKLCDGDDPDDGEDNKFLTITMSETVLQGGRLNLPLEWLGGTVEEPTVLALDEPPAFVAEHQAVEVVLRNQSGMDIGVWAPLWDNSTGEVPTSAQLAAFICERGVASPFWVGPKQCCILSSGQKVQCAVKLLNPVGDGLTVRLQKSNTGTLVIPLKVEGRLRIQRIPI